MGSEALLLLRAEKGYIIAGKDTDGTSMPHDLGVTGPRDKRQSEFVGKRSLFTENASRPDRQQLVGLTVAGATPLPTGAHGVETAGGKRRSIGFVTSSYFSPTLNRPIALGLIERGMERMGEEIALRASRQHDARGAHPALRLRRRGSPPQWLSRSATAANSGRPRRTGPPPQSAATIGRRERCSASARSWSAAGSPARSRHWRRARRRPGCGASWRKARMSFASPATAR